MMRPSLSMLAVLCAAALPLAASAQIKAQDTYTPSYVQFSAPRFEVSETETNAILTLVRSGDYRATASVNFKTLEGTAESNVDFEPAGGTVVFSAGQSFKTITIPVLRNGKPAPDKTFKVELTQPAANTVITAPGAEVAIKQAGPPLAIAIASNNLVVQWPDIGTTCTLEAQTEGGWTAVPGKPILMDGNWRVQIDRTASMALFRLRLE